ncbi:MAG: hypothetical protein OJF50_003700 [Nitrospira sp.]|nr:hypothetical protein [Nitrospira sp.]
MIPFRAESTPIHYRKIAEVVSTAKSMVDVPQSEQIGKMRR